MPDQSAPDQYTFTNPATRYPDVTPPVQQPEPGLQSKMTPVPDLGEESYRGTGRLAGRRALITGADSGIGAAVAIAFAREGADIALSYLPEEEADAQHVVELIRAAGRTAVPIPGDLTDAQYCSDLVEQAVEGLGGLDAVVNIAGKQIWQDDMLELTDEQFETTFKVNVFAPFRIIRAALPHLPAAPPSSTRRRRRRTRPPPTASTTP